MQPRHFALLLLALGALSAPNAAQAAVRTVDYAVTIDGHLDYNRADVDAEASAQHDESIDFRTAIPRLTFFGNAAEDSTGALGTATVTRGSYVITGANAQVRCTSHSVSDVTAGGLDATFAPDHTIFATRVIDAIAVEVGGCNVGMTPWQLNLGSAGDEVGVGMFDGAFSLPHSRIGEASMSFPLKGEVTGSSCPFHYAKTALCSLTWTATVTFTRTGEGEQEIDVPFVPIVPPPHPEPTPERELAPVDDLLIPLVAKARLSKDLGRVSLPLRCAAGCRGSAVASARGRTLARGRFKAAPGKTASVVLRFDAADRRAIRRAGGRLRLKLRATTGGKAVHRTVTVSR